MADEATLRDTIVSDESPATPVAEATPAPTPETPKLDVDPDAAEIGRIILNSGFSKEQVNDLLEAPRALQNMQALLRDNPQEFFNLLQRTDPKIEEKILENAADRYVSRYGEKTPAKGKEADSELMREVEALREQTNRLLTEQQRRDQAAAQAAMRQRYDARVDDLLGLKEVKELGLTKSEVKNLRARLDAEMSRDPAIVRRASNGNFLDVPVVFKSLVDELVTDKKAATEADKSQRERASRSAFPEFENGPNPFIPADTKFTESWDATENAFAEALGRAR